MKTNWLLMLVSFVCFNVRAADVVKPAVSHHTGDGVTSLDVYAEGNRVHLLIATRAAENPAQLQYLHSHDGGATWSAAVPVGAGQPPPEPVHRGMDAQIAAAGDRLVAVWTTQGDEDRYGRGPMATAYSRDGGRTWTAGPNPSDDGKATGHAFVDVTADSHGTFHLVWLDTRSDTVTGKGLRYARSTDGGASWSANVTIDPQTCECCWNTITAAPDGKLFVLYRNRDPRDMAIARSDDAGKTWQKPVTVGAFGWNINGCPHVGGGLSIVPSNNDPLLYAIVWTASSDRAHGAYVLSSRDGGKTWSDPVRPGGPESWHPDIAADGNTVFAVWDAYVDDTSAVFASKSTDRGQTWSPPLRLNSDDSSADHPRIIHTPLGFRVFWTEQQPGHETRWTSRSLR